jgi:ribonuclease HI
VYIPPQQPNITTGEKEVACLPSNEEYPYDDTINRAELAAAWKAIAMQCTHIATNSLAAPFQIHKIVTKPQDIRLGFHRHAALLQQIASAVASSGQPIHIYKVKSHIGIPGNEHADEIATSVAKGTREADETIATPSNNRPSMAWPHHPEVWESGNAAPTPPRPVKDIPALHRLAHRCHKLGSSNTAAICFAAAQAIAHDVEKVSYAFMTSTVVPYGEMVNPLKVMTGTFYSQKRAWWYGRASSDKSVLCGQPDGTLHAVSGCPQLTLAVTKRHNDAVLLLAKAILTGECGSQVVAMDVATETQQAEGIQLMSQFMPAKILPPGMPADEQEDLVKAHRPDIVLYQGKRGAQKKHKYTFVELKYCRDTAPTGPNHASAGTAS